MKHEVSSNIPTPIYKMKKFLKIGRKAGLDLETPILTSPSYTSIQECRPPVYVLRSARKKKARGTHLCLLIDEILRNIAAHLPDNRSCLSMGLCCRAFFEPAMDALWCNLSGLRPLLKCLSEEIILAIPGVGNDTLISEHGSGSLPREEWLRFEYYSRRVRRLMIGKRRDCASAVSFYTEPKFFDFVQVHYPTPGTALPNLQHLEWYDEEDVHYAEIFVRPSLRSLTCSGWLDRSELIVASNPDPPSANPLNDPLVAERLNQLLCHLTNIVTLDLGIPLSEDAITHLSAIPSLRYLSIVFTSTTFRRPPSHPNNLFMFSALGSLKIHSQSDDISASTRFLATISARNLFDLSLGFSLRSPTSAMHPLFEAVGNLQGLSNLELNFLPSLSSVWHEVIVPGDAILPLFKLKGLYTFAIHSLPIQMTTEHWRKMAEAWPLLYSLSVTPLASDSSQAYRTRIPFHDLVIFAELLSELRMLTVETEEPEACSILDVMPLWPPFSMVTDVDLLQSPLPRTTMELSRKFLRQIFPYADFSHAYEDV
ncbi:hypothetical protein PHLGIDRAFT_125012 [Phlebiopsis gigantea 11061_1 CR5-6]|uniref:F-box domain-containing protein n=1 Tax=Phlebiopsis gigantea (strain 11061_1 CR5-6) TaxID=745531 RepID=A0A0C3PU04_PHLG1|nr:hypothetical protein PHLGIDRAFT_125012 [Phlebiopsis gigantea 11061_1 CR5-6]